MNGTVRLGVATVMLGFALGAVTLGAQEGDPVGKVTYDQWCAGCHGVDGGGVGSGSGHMLPRPRDFTMGLYQIRTTGTGELPTDADIMRVIDLGMPGTAMPGWKDLLSEDERGALVEYLKSFSQFFASSPPPEPIDFGRPTRLSDEGLAEGADLWQQIECWRCHGNAGRGDGVSAPTLEDVAGFPIRAADLTENWRFNGGGDVEDIYRRMRTGLDGTPMPSNSDLIDAGVWTEEQLWNVAHYVRSLAPEDPPQPREVIRANRLTGRDLPNEVGDEVWGTVERFYIPMVGQIIQKPRWFDPMVDGLWVQALHDGTDLVMRLSWSDPSQSPDSTWAPWRAAVTEIMEPNDGVDFEAGPLPDRVAVQFPTTVTQDRERPYFLMGDASNPVSLWLWSNDDEGVREGQARGLGAIVEGEGTQDLGGEAVFQDGQWMVLFRRALQTDDVTQEAQIPLGQPVPVGFFAWDGDNGESGARSAVSSWYFVYLTEPTKITVFVPPIIALILTGALGLTVVSRAQERMNEERPEEMSDLNGV